MDRQYLYHDRQITVLLRGQHAGGDADGKQHAELPAGRPSFASARDKSRQPGDHHGQQRKQDRRNTLLPVGDGEVFERDDTDDIPLHSVTVKTLQAATP